jgi:hypothetical protein
LRLAAILLVMVAMPATAAADPRCPGQRAAHEPELDAMLATAQAFWQARNVASPCAETVLDVADNLIDLDVPYNPDGRAWSPLAGLADCRIALDAAYTGQRLERMRRPHRTPWPGRRAARELCRVVTHEEGHVRGLATARPASWLRPGPPTRCRGTAACSRVSWCRHAGPASCGFGELPRGGREHVLAEVADLRIVGQPQRALACRQAVRHAVGACERVGVARPGVR